MPPGLRGLHEGDPRVVPGIEGLDRVDDEQQVERPAV